MRPSIMSDGAMMSAPASACITAARTIWSTVSSLTMIAVAQDAVMAVAGEGIERHVGDDADIRHRLLEGARSPG